MANVQEQQPGRGKSTESDDCTFQTPNTSHSISKKPVNFIKLENASRSVDHNIMAKMLL